MGVAVKRNGWRSVARDLLPPLVVRWLRPAPVVPTAPATAAEQVVQGGPLKGYSLLVDATRPAFAEMVAGVYDDFLWRALPAQLGDGCILDVGAHIGYHALSFAAFYPGRRVVAFEPNPANCARLQHNLDLNTSLAERIGLFPVALGDHDGRTGFNASTNVDDQTSSGGYLQGASPPLDDSVYQRSGFVGSTVAVRRLDGLVREYGWGPVALIKIDVEGAEQLVLTGALELLRRDRPLLFIEVHSVACMLAVCNILQPLGYAVQLLQLDRPGRGFVMARSVGMAIQG
jgi:FkbM family methyltransferase